MKRLVLKRWVELLLVGISCIGLTMVAAFEWNSPLPYLIGMALLVIPSIIEFLYGRGI